MTADNIETLLQRAKQAIEERTWDKAKQIYLQALGLKSDLPDIHYGLATVYFQLKELTSAAHHFKEVARLDPLRAGAYINLGAVLNLLAQHDEAVAALRRGIQIDTNRVEGYYNLGLVYRRKGQLDMAIQAYKEAIRINPRMADAHLNLANVYYDKGQYRQALQHYEQALAVRAGWQKANEGLAQARAAIDREAVGVTEGEQGPISKISRPSGTDLDKLVDPNVHGTALASMHQAAIDTEEQGRLFEQVLEQEIEPAIKDLSACLMYPEAARTDLGECVSRFETALENMRNIHQTLQGSVAKVRDQADKFQAE
jgi:tetratricopeptide (TPR) repeat protein